MKRYITHWVVGRESRSAMYFGILFGTAVFTILAIRGFLAATGYPQLGGDSLHIAHMLWGGIFMLMSIIILIYIHGHRAKIVGAFVGGVGFGFFIDELGKFITNDNDYFYQPTAMLIYIIFVLLWALFEWLDNYAPSTPRQHYIDLLTRLRDSAVNGMSATDKDYIKKQSDAVGLSKKEQTVLFQQIQQFTPRYQPGSVVRAANGMVSRLESALNTLVTNKVTPLIIFATITVSAAASLIIFILALLNNLNIFDAHETIPTIIEVGLLAATLLSIACVMSGFIYSRINWHKTLMWYRRAMLVNVFGTQVFLFYVNQFTAAFGLVFSLLFLYVLTIQVHEYDSKK